MGDRASRVANDLRVRQFFSFAFFIYFIHYAVLAFVFLLFLSLWYFYDCTPISSYSVSFFSTYFPITISNKSYVIFIYCYVFLGPCRAHYWSHCDRCCDSEACRHWLEGNSQGHNGKLSHHLIVIKKYHQMQKLSILLLEKYFFLHKRPWRRVVEITLASYAHAHEAVIILCVYASCSFTFYVLGCFFYTYVCAFVFLFLHFV